MNPKKPTSRPVSGFTLVELLVVIVIIASLAAITFTVAPRMRKRGDATKSLQNLRQAGALMALYASDHSSVLPAPEVWTENPNGSTDKVAWYAELLSIVYSDVNQPAFSDTQWWETNKPFMRNPVMSKTVFKPWYNGYAINMSLAFNAKVQSASNAWGVGGPQTVGVPLSKISEPARTPLVSTTKNWFYRAADLSLPENKPLLIDGKLPVMFVDAHVETMSPAEYVSRNLGSMPRQ